ncbi:alpha-D-kanosaminyltransferase [mine drainage metagenome]|uniref:Alpha-D-kanosaminyltransferase n=1 Tax=mine drainage metagenome TaxID=410659 RepID=A0A1J5SIP3_9ZZZZ
MNLISQPSIIAYLAPEIPALSATFVYEEMFGLQDLGYSILPITVHNPTNPAYGQDQLISRTFCLYDQAPFIIVFTGVFRLPIFGVGAFKALRLLLSDLSRCGLHRLVTWKLAYQFIAAVKLASLLKSKNCSHLHVHFAHVPSQIAMYASAMSGVPFTIMAHANDIFERGLLLRKKAERAVKLVTISEFNRAYLERIGVPKDKLAVVRCGVSFPIVPPDRPFEKKAHYRLGTLGRLVEKKGIDVLIRSIAELQNRPYEIELSIAGDGPLREELEALARVLNVAQCIKFEGSMTHGAVAKWMRGLDAVVLACKKDKNGDMDGIPVVLMEAMSQSVPVISTRISGIPELIIHELTGLLAKPDDCQDLAFQIDRLLDSAELRERLVIEAAEHVKSEFGRNVNLKRLLTYFPKVMLLPR